MPKTLDEPRTGLPDLIANKQVELEKLNNKIADLDDPEWLADKKQKLRDKAELVEQELSILLGAHSQLKKKAS
ncbi:MAG TPA: hypothetical protein VGO93_12090 [Candidatus Xenobia bacterium]|jgi:predicted ribosome quality control (RQC) complex YloA/Tae2 family protein